MVKYCGYMQNTLKIDYFFVLQISSIKKHTVTRKVCQNVAGGAISSVLYHALVRDIEM